MEYMQLWFIDNNIEQETILLSGEYNPYDTGCTFNLKRVSFTISTHLNKTKTT